MAQAGACQLCKKPTLLSEGDFGNSSSLQALYEFLGYGRERIGGRDAGRDLLQLPSRGRILAGEELPFGLFPLLTRLDEGKGGVRAKRELLRLARESIGKAPNATAVRINRRCRPPPSNSLYGLSFGLALRNARSVRGICRHLAVGMKSMPTSMPTRTRDLTGPLWTLADHQRG